MERASLLLQIVLVLFTKFCPNTGLEVFNLLQDVDHFVNGSAQFSMRCFYRDATWKSGGPVYVYIGDESSLDSMKKYMTSGLVADLARETHGVIYMVEHRYYGESTISDDLEDRKYGNLTVKQVLADIAHFIRTLKENESLKNAKIVAVGGSYAGRLATWMRLKYPELVDAAIASSAPLKNVPGFPEYYDTVAQVYREYGGENCLRAIRKKIQHERNLLRRESGENIFKEEETLCPEVNISQKLEKTMYATLALNEISEPVFSFNAQNILTKCSDILSPSGTGDSGDGCYNYDFGISGWEPNPYDFLRCSELAQFPTSTERSMLPFDITMELYNERCMHVYGAQYDADHMRRALSMLDDEYGGLKPNVTKVVFVNGGLDPWHHLGVLNDLNPEAPAILMRNTTHCQDLEPADSHDSRELSDVRIRITELIKNWIGFRTYASIDNWTFFKPRHSWGA